MPRDFIMPKKIITGKGGMKEIGKEGSKYGKKALVVTGKHTSKDGTIDILVSYLTKEGIYAVVFDQIIGEPTDVMIKEGVDLYKRESCDFLIGIGGGSALDAMKAIAVLTAEAGDLADYMGCEIIENIPAMIAIPTTAGTGSEVTQFTIITDTKTEVKMLLRGSKLIPDLAIIDPTLTISSPKSVTASSGLDALTHAIEAYTSKKSQALSDVMAVSAVKRIFKSLPTAYQNGQDEEAREQMALAALEAGIAFNNSSVTLIHGMSRPIGAIFHVPHGISNAMLLPLCLNYMMDGTYERFAALGRAIGVATEESSKVEAARDFMNAVQQLCAFCEIPTLKQYGIDEVAFKKQIKKMATDAMASGSPLNTRKTINIDMIENLYTELWKTER